MTMKKTRKKLFSLLLTMVMVLGMAPAMSLPAQAADNGDVWWKFFNNTLYISDKQEDDDYKCFTAELQLAIAPDEAAPPWNGDKENCLKVEIMGAPAPVSTVCWFAGFESLSEIRNLHRLDTSNVTNMLYMFYDCRSLYSLDLSGFDVTSVTSMEGMFEGCSNLMDIYAAPETDWSDSNARKNNMFNGCTWLAGGAGTACNGTNNINGEYARIDGGLNQPGYFTERSTVRYSVTFNILPDDVYGLPAPNTIFGMPSDTELPAGAFVEVPNVDSSETEIQHGGKTVSGYWEFEWKQKADVEDDEPVDVTVTSDGSYIEEMPPSNVTVTGKWTFFPDDANSLEFYFESATAHEDLPDEVLSKLPFPSRISKYPNVEVDLSEIDTEDVIIEIDYTDYIKKGKWVFLEWEIIGLSDDDDPPFIVGDTPDKPDITDNKFSMPAYPITVIGKWKYIPGYDLIYSFAPEVPGTDLPDDVTAKLPNPSRVLKFEGDEIDLTQINTDDVRIKTGNGINLWRFKEWLLVFVDGPQPQPIESTKFKMPDRPTWVEGIWKVEPVPQKNLTYVYSGDVPADSILPDAAKLPAKPESVFVGEPVTVRQNPADITVTDGDNPGTYKFQGWDTSGLDEGKMPDKDVTITGTWLFVPKGNIVVTFDARGGKVNGLDKDTATAGPDGKLASLPEPKRGGNYVFQGWFTEASGGERVYLSRVYTTNTTIYAHWKYEGGGGPDNPTTYKLTYQTNGGSEIKATNHTKGTTVNLTAVPTKEGFTFDGWHSDAALTNKITSVKMDSDKTVYAGWKENDKPDIPEIITPDALDGENHIKYVVGYPDGSFRPNQPITRAEAAAMIYRLLKAERRVQIYTASNKFSDVTSALWYNEPVSSMANGGYIAGYPDGTFGGGKDITRAEFVTMLVNFMGVSEGTATFSDVKESHWAYKFIATASSNGLVSGYPDGTFRPDQSITRAEAASIINRILNRGVNETSRLGDFKNFSDNTNPSAWYYFEIIEAANSHEYEGRRPNETWTSITSN